jgi:hypothetical protein
MLLTYHEARIAIPRLKKHELETTVWYKVKIEITPKFLATTVNETAIIHKQSNAIYLKGTKRKQNLHNTNNKKRRPRLTQGCSVERMDGQTIKDNPI